MILIFVISFDLLFNLRHLTIKRAERNVNERPNIATNEHFHLPPPVATVTTIRLSVFIGHPVCGDSYNLILDTALMKCLTGILLVSRHFLGNFVAMHKLHVQCSLSDLEHRNWDTLTLLSVPNATFVFSDIGTPHYMYNTQSCIQSGHFQEWLI